MIYQASGVESLAGALKKGRLTLSYKTSIGKRLLGVRKSLPDDTPIILTPKQNILNYPTRIYHCRLIEPGINAG